MTDSYRVQLEVFTGPLDLLLYLIKRDELDVYDIPIVRITEQYLEHIRVLEQLDPNTAGEFIVMAATLIELKSRALLPTPPIEPLGEAEDPRAPLVRQLLEYKRFKDAARSLGSAADDRAKRYVRSPAELPKELAGVELEEVQIWDLLSAFAKVMTAVGRGPGEHAVRYDDIPIELHAAEIVAVLEQEGPTTFQSLFSRHTSRVQIVGCFLALLDLVRRSRVRAEQEGPFGTIYLFLLEEAQELPEEEYDEELEPDTDEANAGAATARPSASDDATTDDEIEDEDEDEIDDDAADDSDDDDDDDDIVDDDDDDPDDDIDDEIDDESDTAADDLAPRPPAAPDSEPSDQTELTDEQTQ